MLVNQRVSAPWPSPFCWSDSRPHTVNSGSFHSPTLFPGFVGECSFVGEFGVSLGSGYWRQRIDGVMTLLEIQVSDNLFNFL